MTALMAILVLLIALGAYAAYYMEHAGHHVTGMSNQVVWGVPHVFAITLIIAASGALNVASMASVFKREIYRPFARLSILIAVSLLVGGLVILVLDLGRPDRLTVAMRYYNFKSVFAWNIFLYTGFIAIALIYLWTLMEGRLNRHSGVTGTLAFVWRLVLTTGTGCIFGFLVARPAYNAAVMAPLFIAMSLSGGLAAFVLIALPVLRRAGTPVDPAVLARFARLLTIFVWAVFYLTVVQHIASSYTAELRDFERFVLLDGGRYTAIFWLGQLVVGTAAPLLLLRTAASATTHARLLAASALVIAGILSQLFVLIVAYQAYPLTLFHGKTIIESSFFDGSITHYAPSVPELALGVGGVALALFIALVGMRSLRLVPHALPALPSSQEREA